jgi:peptidyl-prolyl cis-trans isomerase C
MKTLGILSGVALLAAWMAAGCDKSRDPPQKPGAPSEPGAVASVNGTPILRSEFQGALAHAERSVTLQGKKIGTEEHKALRARVMDKLIETELLVQHAGSLGIQISPEELDRKLGEVLEAGGGDAAFTRYLAETGQDRGRVRANLERTMMIWRLEERLRAEVRLTDEELAAYHREHADDFRLDATVDLAHILFRDAEGQEDALTRAGKVREEIRAGLAFGQAARKHSEDAMTRDDGGKLGVLNRADMIPELSSPAFSIEVGTVSAPVRSPMGIHLLWVHARTPGELPPLAEVRGSIEKRLLDARAEARIRALVEKLTADALIKRNSP